MDAGVIKYFKHIYRKKVLRKQIHVLDEKAEFKMDLKEAIFLISFAWRTVKPTTIQNCFHHTKLILPSESEIIDVTIV